MLVVPLLKYVGRRPISTTSGVQHRPRDATAKGAKAAAGVVVKPKEPSALYMVAAIFGGAFVFVSIFIVACFLSIRQKRRIQEPIPLQQNESSLSPSHSHSGKYLACKM